MVGPEFGPFSVVAEQVASLGAAFTPFVNRLLITETAAAGLAGTSLVTTYRENIGDKGVDAGLRADTTTRWIPLGESAWQFKAGDLEPAACKKELKGADAALEVLRQGGRYRLVLGASLTADKVKRRRNALIQEAEQLGIVLKDDSIDVMTADSLAAWAEEYPALAVWPPLGGIDYGAIPFENWSASNNHATTWVPSESRADVQQAIRDLLTVDTYLDMRVMGVSGMGKTRLVMETLREADRQPLVVYLPSADLVAAQTLNRLLSQDRSAIVVVDECSGKRHKLLAERLPTGSRVRLITIGEPDNYQLQSPVFVPAPLDEAAMDQIVQGNRPTLWPEARRVIIEMAAGNVQYALFLAKVVSERPNTSVSDLLTVETIKQYVSQSLPTGAVFLACSVLALFRRIGYEADLASELEVIGDGLGFTVHDLRAAARTLAESGLLSSQGRYRSVTPHPLAVYFATAAWEEYGDQIVQTLLPLLTPSLSRRLFQRAADIGQFDVTRWAVVRLLGEDGPFASLESMERSESADLLTQFAIVAPREVCERVAELIDSASEDELHQRTTIRRGLVWTLDKLVWHTYTFERAADALLRLALAENETWSNNATGTWVELFGVMLPGTAARPAQRLTYLRNVVAADDVRVRKISVAACERALSLHESIMLSGELQGGSLVEPRGRPETYEEAWTYLEQVMDLVRSLAADADGSIRDQSIGILVSAIHPVLENERLRGHLAKVILSLPGEAMRRARTEIEHLAALFDRVDTDTAARAAGLEAFRTAFPAPSVEDELRSLVNTRRWDFDEGVLEQRILDAVGRLDGSPEDFLFELLDEQISASFEVGKALALNSRDPRAAEVRLAALVQGENSPALPGFLWGLQSKGDDLAFDRFLDEGPGRELENATRLGLTVRGPHSTAAERRVEDLARLLPVAEATQYLFGWHRDLIGEPLRVLVEEWLSRLTSQQDYNALVDYIALTLHGDREGMEILDPLLFPLLALRRTYPEIAQQSWDWAQIGLRVATDNPQPLVELMFDLVDADVLHLYAGEEADLLKVAIRRGQPEAWVSAMERLAGGSWQLEMAVDGWLADLVPIDFVRQWVGTDVRRARVVAAAATTGDESTMHPIAVFLLTEFPGDQGIESALYGDFVSGGWTGNESDRLRTQIDQIRGWLEVHGEVGGIRQWCQKVLSSLEARLSTVLVQEAEEEF
jgi:hypothetical protein